jgi:hypothetical protein
MSPYEIALSVSLGFTLVSVAMVNLRVIVMKRKLDQTFHELNQWGALVTQKVGEHEHALTKKAKKKENSNV